jgi:DNA-binding NarL/FixJ family response regulator
LNIGIKISIFKKVIQALWVFMEKIKLLIVVSNKELKKEFIHLCSHDDEIQIIGSSEDDFKTIDVSENKTPDVILLDFPLNRRGPFKSKNSFRMRSPYLRCIIFTNEIETNDVFSNIQAGINGYLLKTIVPSSLIEGIKVIHRGKSILHPAIKQKILTKSSALNKKDATKIDELSKREIEVIQLMAGGLSNKQIADRLFISVKTVKSHITHIMEKLKTINRTESVLCAIKNNLVNIEI